MQYRVFDSNCWLLVRSDWEPVEVDNPYKTVTEHVIKVAGES